MKKEIIVGICIMMVLVSCLSGCVFHDAIEIQQRDREERRSRPPPPLPEYVIKNRTGVVIDAMFTTSKHYAYTTILFEDNGTVTFSDFTRLVSSGKIQSLYLFCDNHKGENITIVYNCYNCGTIQGWVVLADFYLVGSRVE